jgi:NAD(P)H-dependent FMN reductase
MYIPIILGTARTGRRSENVAKYVLAQVKKAELETELIDVRDYRLTATDRTGLIPEAIKLAGKVTRADGLIIVTPEYNHSFPGELKMMLDMLYKEYFYKPVAFCGVSNGLLGGARGIQSLRLVCIALGMYPIIETVYFRSVDDLFDDQGQIKEQSYEKGLSGLIKSLVEHAAVLKNREKK